MTTKRAKSASELQDELDRLAEKYTDLYDAHEALKGNMTFPKITSGELIFRFAWLAAYENHQSGDTKTVTEAMAECQPLQALKESA